MIIHWALHVVKRWQEHDFKVAIYYPYYEEAMCHITQIRSLEPKNIQLKCLNIMTSQLLQRGKELIAQYQVVVDYLYLLVI